MRNRRARKPRCPEKCGLISERCADAFISPSLTFRALMAPIRFHKQVLRRPLSVALLPETGPRCREPASPDFSPVGYYDGECIRSACVALPRPPRRSELLLSTVTVYCLRPERAPVAYYCCATRRSSLRTWPSTL